VVAELVLSFDYEVVERSRNYLVVVCFSVCEGERRSRGEPERLKNEKKYFFKDTETRRKNSDRVSNPWDLPLYVAASSLIINLLIDF
jgi:hypothetical protein